MKEAIFYEKLEDQKVQCRLCPHNCVIPEGKAGICGVRKNEKGILYSLIYEEITSLALDPIEKKPLSRFFPGSFILSIGTKGCNFSCPFCQNWAISKELNAPTQKVKSEFLIQRAQEVNSLGIAYTYNEPFIWYEFVFDTAKMAQKEGLQNVLVTNGFINQEPLKKLLPFINAMNIDLKSIDEHFYRTACAGSLNPVLETIKESSKHCHIEITNLIIPTLNDSVESIEKLVNWIYENVGEVVPLHLSRYHPCYKLGLPMTPVETMRKAEEIAKEKLRYVYLGNM